nr:hypothetical protein [Cytophagales bacterium]
MNSVGIEKLITHKLFRYFKFVGLFIILVECIDGGTLLFEYLRVNGTDQQWRFSMVLISFIIKLSLFVSALLASILHELYEEGKIGRGFLFKN